MQPNHVTRGIPSGYISFIEQRLLETEIVVLELLSAIYKSQVPIEPLRLPERDRRLLAEYSQKQTKSHKIEEWRNFPLATEEQRHAWWLKKNERVAEATEANGDRAPQQSPSAASPGMTDSPRTIYHESLQPSGAEHSALASIRQPLLTQSSWQPIADGSGLSDPNPMLGLPEQPTTGISLHQNTAAEVYPEIPEVSAPSPAQPASVPCPAADARWRKYF